jgi:MFS family permease
MLIELFDDSMFLLYFVNAMQSSILYNLVPFATSDYESHSLLTVIYIVANSMTAAIYIPLAKLLDLWGRAEGFVVMVGFATLGLIMMAGCNGLTTFCVAQVIPHALRMSTFSYILINSASGFLFHRFRRIDLHHRCHHRRCIKAEESRSSLCFHLVTVHYYGIRWS